MTKTRNVYVYTINPKSLTCWTLFLQYLQARTGARTNAQTGLGLLGLTLTKRRSPVFLSFFLFFPSSQVVGSFFWFRGSIPWFSSYVKVPELNYYLTPVIVSVARLCVWLRACPCVCVWISHGSWGEREPCVLACIPAPHFLTIFLSWIFQMLTLGTYFMACLFFSVYAMAVDTLFLCFCMLLALVSKKNCIFFFLVTKFKLYSSKAPFSASATYKIVIVKISWTIYHI